MKQLGIFSTVTEIVQASKDAFKAYGHISLRQRHQVIHALREELLGRIDELAHMSCNETGMGKVNHKIEKIRLAIEETPGPEELEDIAKQGEGGIVLIEPFPYGVTCAIHPSTNPCETMINNTIGILSAGNVVINCPHPRAMGVSKYLTHIMNQTIFRVCGIPNVVVTMDSCLLEYIKEIMNHPDVELIVSTGGSDNARSALSCSKKVFSGGPANPTFIVDETADIERAAYCISRGASFDNNITCTSEKNIVVVQSVLDQFRKALETYKVYYTDSLNDMLKLSKLLLTEDMNVNRQYGGKGANEILQAAGIVVNQEYDLIAVETVKLHPFVTKELLVPLIAIVPVKDFETALEVGVEAEQCCHHTAGIHSTKTERLRLASKAFNTAIFIKNGCSLDGIGVCGVGGTAFTIANVTGEGAISVKDFVKHRRCVFVETIYDY